MRTYSYVTQNGKVVRQGWLNITLDFTYDESGRPFAMIYTSGTETPVTYYYVLNLQGDVVGLIDESGEWVAQYTYNAWGEVLSVTNASGTAITSSTHIANLNPLRYRGYYFDSETGFYYLQSRYYDPVTHRFINADSLASTGQGIIGTNMFVYCLNNPVQRTDGGGTASWHYSVTLRNEGPSYDVNNPSPKSVAMREQVAQILDKAEYSEAAWESLDNEGRKALLDQLAGELTAVMGISINGIEHIENFPGNDGTVNAFYDDVHNTVCYIVETERYMTYAAITTLVHELYHAYQHAAVNDKTNHLGEPYAIVQLWAINQRPENYISDGVQYFNQPVEVSAFWFSGNINASYYIGCWGGYYANP